MCSLETEPWRANFTGPKCRCGVPTPGNDAERAIDKLHYFSPEQVTEEMVEKVRKDIDRRILNDILDRMVP
jgi:hypothetical protein